MVSPIPIKVCASDILPKIRLCFEVPRPSKGRRQNAKSITRVLVEVSKWSRRFTLRTQIANNIDTRVPAAGVQLLVGMYYRYCCSTAKWNGLSAKPLGISREHQQQLPVDRDGNRPWPCAPGRRMVNVPSSGLPTFANPKGATAMLSEPIFRCRRSNWLVDIEG